MLDPKESFYEVKNQYNTGIKKSKKKIKFLNKKKSSRVYITTLSDNSLNYKSEKKNENNINKILFNQNKKSRRLKKYYKKIPLKKSPNN